MNYILYIIKIKIYTIVIFSIRVIKIFSSSIDLGVGIITISSSPSNLIIFLYNYNLILFIPLFQYSKINLINYFI